MIEFWFHYILPAVIGGSFGIASAVLTARFTSKADRNRAERELRLRLDTWDREMGVRYAEIKRTNTSQATALREQFAKAFLHFYAEQPRTSDRHFISNGMRLSIGGADDCDIIIKDENISARAAFIEMSATGGLQIADLHSTGGVKVNGTKLGSGQLHRLKDGDEVAFGAVTAKVRLIPQQ